jgi:hypothetical protein
VRSKSGCGKKYYTWIFAGIQNVVFVEQKGSIINEMSINIYDGGIFSH